MTYADTKHSTALTLNCDLGNQFTKLLSGVVRKNQEYRNRGVIRSQSAHMLRDIGLTRQDVHGYEPPKIVGHYGQLW